VSMNITVQFCPCGHVATLNKDSHPDMFARAEEQYRKKPERLDAPLFHSDECFQCQSTAVGQSDIF